MGPNKKGAVIEATFEDETETLVTTKAKNKLQCYNNAAMAVKGGTKRKCPRH